MHRGVEWLVDAHGCLPARLRDRAAVLGVLDRIVAAMDLHVVSTAVHAFPGGGRHHRAVPAGRVAPDDPHVPEAGTATLNAYGCRPRAAPPWPALLGELLGAREVTATEHARGQIRSTS